MNIPTEFDDIRPYLATEMPNVIDELAQDKQFKDAMAMAMPELPFDMLIAKAKECKSLMDFQIAFDYPLLKKIIKEHTEGLDMQAEKLDKQNNYTFISNHRDIVLDSAFLSEMLVDLKFRTTAELAVGDNLLLYPWIKKIVKLNKGIIVKRALGLREQLIGSQQLSRYIHFATSEKKENIWIAQRQGRCKDSDDRTQQSILKMLCMGGDGTLKERLKSLHIVPLSISYEFDPCDYLKAKEFQQKRDNENFKKDYQDDLVSMQTGIFGYKGHVHFQASACLDEWLDALPDNITKNDFFAFVAEHIDHAIHSNYRLYPNNYIAADRLKEGERFATLYTEEEKDRFDKYIHQQIERVDLPNADITFLERKLLEMYSNPLYNYLKAAENKHNAI